MASEQQQLTYTSQKEHRPNQEIEAKTESIDNTNDEKNKENDEIKKQSQSQPKVMNEHRAETELIKLYIAALISIKIDNEKYLTLKHKKDSFVLYPINISVNTKRKTSWNVYLKYSEMDTFHRKMEYWINRACRSDITSREKIKLPSFPPKKPWKFDKFDRKFIAERIRLFNIYFIELTKYISYSTRKSQLLFMKTFNIDGLYKYVMNEDIEILSELAKYDENMLLSIDKNKSNLLHFAVSANSVKCIEFMNKSLIQRLMHQKDHFKWTPLTLAKELNAVIYKLLCCVGAYDEKDIEIQQERIPIQYTHNICKYKRKLWIIVNPQSGNHEANGIWTEGFKPFLDYNKEYIEYDVSITQEQYYAQKECESLSIQQKYDAIVVFGGDGTIVEVLNGFYYNKNFKNNMPCIVPIACGSGNGLAKELNIGHMLDAMRTIIGGFQTCIDAYIASQIGENDIYAFVSSQWGVISSIDLESENMRWLGAIRFTLKGLSQVMYSPIYKARIYLKPIDIDEKEIETERTVNDATDWWKSLEVIDFDKETTSDKDRGEYPSDWICIDGEFELLCVTNLQWIGEDCKMGGKDFNAQSNALRLVYNKKSGRYNQAATLFAMETGDHLDLQSVKYYDVEELVIEPLSKGPPMDVDGEGKPLKPLYVKLLPSHFVVCC